MPVPAHPDSGPEITTPLRILYAEDESADAELVQLFLKSAGLQANVDRVITEPEFSQKLRSNQYDLILTDFQMRTWNGNRVLDIVREENKNIPVILVTGTIGDELAVEIIKKGAADYVLKERLSRLSIAIPRALREHRVQRERAEAVEQIRKLNLGLEQRITERTAELSAANQRLEHASRFKDEFLSTMSHELRTPLNAVLGFSQMLQDERHGTLNDRQVRYLKHIYQGGQHLLRLINDILDLSRIEAGRMEISLEDVMVGVAFDEVIGTLRPLALEKSQTLERSVEPALRVRADAFRLQQVLINLVGNAIKFTPAGGRIHLSAKADAGNVHFEVRDNGPGIPPEAQGKIFDAFYRVGNKGSTSEGSGLGLAITRRLVELQHGAIGLKNCEPQGSCFYFALPGASAIFTSVAPQSGATKPLTPASVLVIEDDAAAASLIQSQLTSFGYDVTVCLEPQRAVEIAARLKPDAITLDLIMAPVNGLEIFFELKKRAETAATPIAVITVVDDGATRAVVGADEYLIKPVERGTLLQAIRRCLPQAAPQSRPLLVVEDNDPMREAITELLTTEGFQVIAASDGAEARRLVKESHPELVILDLILPSVSGFELLAEWRANPATADLPVLVLTSKDLSPTEEKYLRRKSELLLRKDSSWQEALLQQLRRIFPSIENGRP